MIPTTYVSVETEKSVEYLIRNYIWTPLHTGLVLVIHVNYVGEVADSVPPDQSGLIGVKVTLFAQVCVAVNLEELWYFCKPHLLQS